MNDLHALDPPQARAFSARWLPAWTGNDPEHLLSFYADDDFYSDQAILDGVEGREALLGYSSETWSSVSYPVGEPRARPTSPSVRARADQRR